MTDERDPLDPEAWHGEPDVCGSCIAWKPDDPRPGEAVAAGTCRLRAELHRVPATLRKCDLYKGRGKFVYQPAPSAGSRRRKRTAAAKVLKRSDEGKLVEIRSAPPPRSSPGPKMPIQRPSAPREIDVGTDELHEVKRAFVEVLRTELRGSDRELAGRYEGGKVQVVTEGRKTRTLSAERFFAKLETMRTALDELEDAVVRSDALLPLVPEVRAQVLRIQGSFTTFNILYARREDYFSGKG